MLHRLAAFGTLIHNQAISARSALAPDIRRLGEQSCDGSRLRGGDETGCITRVVCRHRKHVRWGLRTQVFDDEDLVVAEHLTRWNLASHDLAKDAVRIALRSHYGFGFNSSKLIAVSGRGMYPPIDDLKATGTAVCTIAIAGTWSTIIALAWR